MAQESAGPDVEKVQKTVFNSLDQYMSCIDKVEWKIVVEFLEKGLKINPSAFVSGSNSDGPGIPGFLLWFLNCLARMLAIPACASDFSSRICQCSCEVLELFRTKDEVFLGTLFRIYIKLLSDVAELMRLYLSRKLVFPVYCMHFTSASQCYVVDYLQINSIEELCCLQTGIISLIRKFPSDICQLHPQVLSVLFQAVCLSIDCGSLATKKEAVILAEETLLRKASVPKVHIDKLIWCLISLVSEIPTLVDSRIREPLEQSLADCLKAVFYPPGNESSVATVRFWKLLFPVLCEHLVSAAFASSTKGFQVCIGELLWRCCMLDRKQINSALDSIFSLIGKAENLQPLSACFYIAMNKQSSIGTNSEISVSEKVVQSLLELSLKSKQELTSCSERSVIFNMEGCRFLLDVVTRVSIKNDQKMLDVDQLETLWRSTEFLFTNGGLLMMKTLHLALDCCELLVLLTGGEVPSFALNLCCNLVQLAWQEKFDYMEHQALAKVSSVCLDGRLSQDLGAIYNGLLAKIPALQVAAVKALAFKMNVNQRGASHLLKALREMGDIDRSVQLVLAQEIPKMVLLKAGFQLKVVYQLNQYNVPVNSSCNLMIPQTDSSIRCGCSDLLSLLKLLDGSNYEETIIHLVENVAELLPFIDNTSVIKSQCLQYLKCHSPMIWKAMSKHVQLFFPNGSVSSTVDHQLLNELKEVFSSGTEHNLKLQGFVAVVFGQVGRCATGDLLISCIIVLLKFSLETSIVLHSTARVQIRKLAATHKLAPSKLLSKFKEPICEFLVEVLHQREQLFCTDEMRSNLLRQVARTFEVNFKDFLKSIIELFIPLIVCRASTSSSAALSFFSRTLNTTKGAILMNNFMYVFSYLIKNLHDQEDLNTVSKFLKSETDFELTALLKSDTKNVLNQLVLHLSTHKDRILAGINMLSTMNHSIEERGLDNLRKFLEPHLLGVVAFYNKELIFSHHLMDAARSKLVICSLIELMNLLGPEYITPVRMKVEGILRQCLMFKDVELIRVTCSAWSKFVRSIEVNYLGPLLSQIVVTLSSFVEVCPEAVTDVFEYLIIKNGATLGSFFNDIYSIPDVPVLASVNAALREHLKQTENPTLMQMLMHALKGVCHERGEVRLHALKYLNKLMESNIPQMQKYTVGSETVDPVITEIITSVFKTLRGSTGELREEYGKCIGILGAIDPGRLYLPVNSSKPVKHFEVNSDFAKPLLNELARAYLAGKTTQSQDCCSFAIQEVLKNFDCANTDPQSVGRKIWLTLTGDTQEILLPHFSSCYSASSISMERYSGPIFNPTKKVTFQDWIRKFTTLLIHKLDNTFHKELFLPCSLVFKHDIQLALFVLPHILTCVLCNDSQDVHSEISQEIMTVMTQFSSTKDVSINLAESAYMCSQAIFSALDHLTAWIDYKLSLKKSKNPDTQCKIEGVQAFVKSLPKDVLSLGAFRCQAYTRSLMYIESFLNENRGSLDSNILEFIQKLYFNLCEPDGVAGVAALRTSQSSLSDQILQYQSKGDHRNAAACYERAIELDSDEVSHREGLLRCMMKQGELTSVLSHVNGLQTEKPQWMQKLNVFRIEASWKLGQWDDLEKFLKMDPNTVGNWNVTLGKLLITAKQTDYEGFISQLKRVRNEQMGPLSATSSERHSYHSCYEYVVRLHMLQELEEGVMLLKNLTSSVGDSDANSLISSWQGRLKATQKSFKVQEDILSLRRVVLGFAESKFEREIGMYWLKSAKIARRTGHMQTAHSFLLNASDFFLPDLCLEKAKWMKNQGNSHEALLTLQQSVCKQWPDVSLHEEKLTGSSTHSKALLLIGQWMEDTAHCDTQTVLKQYKSVVSILPESEDGHFHLGKYYDHLMSVLVSDRPTKTSEFLHFIIRHYGSALEFGNKYIFQCMPRMLALWLDFGSKVPDNVRKSQERTTKVALTALNDLMSKLKDKLPPYQFFIAFSQLISRICHPNSEVFSRLEAIILKLVANYPQQSLWMMVAVNKSTHPDRQNRCRQILEKAKHDLPHIEKLIADIVKLCDRLVDLCNKQVEPSKQNSMDKICRGLIRLTASSDFSSIMVPLQSSLTVTLPAGHGVHPDHDPFPAFQPTIWKFDDKVEVLPSLQRPKKVVVYANDGKQYILMCKPKDDLRKDSRLMEFNSVVNKCLRKDPDCRSRHLYIRTYAVVPLNEECGVLEWVSNTHGLRNILQRLYQERGVHLSGRKLKEMADAAKSDPLKLRELFVSRLLPLHPPIFGEWFLRSFPDPSAWYFSRLAYARTVAVMSMVGYVLGLGDRHGENILFDSTSGDCVHVDFNCLFNRGETFDVPEVVPFRLTQNMVHAMGVAGYEGIFRRSCEATMKVMRQQCEPLLCVLKTFIHDPLVEWGKVKGRTASSEATNEKAIKIVKDMEDRLQGKYKSRGLPLSVEGQVHTLIKDATDIDNLSRMYIGWAPYL